MRKADFLILGPIIFILIILLVLFSNAKKVDINNCKVVITVNNVVVDQFFLQDITINYHIHSQVDSDIYIYKNDQIHAVEVNKYRLVIDNKITVCNGEVFISSANCQKQTCLQMIINQDHFLPIICSNGIVIRLVAQQEIDIVV